jgi:hypothetical protein
MLSTRTQLWLVLFKSSKLGRRFEYLTNSYPNLSIREGCLFVLFVYLRFLEGDFVIFRTMAGGEGILNFWGIFITEEINLKFRIDFHNSTLLSRSCSHWEQLNSHVYTWVSDTGYTGDHYNTDLHAVYLQPNADFEYWTYA